MRYPNFTSQAREDEELVLSYIINYPDTYAKLLLKLSSELFPNYRKIFKEFQNAFRTGGLDGLISAMARLFDEEHDTMSYLLDVSRENISPIEAILDGAIDRLKKLAEKRKIYEVLDTVLSSPNSVGIDYALERLQEFKTILESRNSKISIADRKEEFLNDPEETPIALPFVGVDAYPGDIVLITAKTKSGKTTLALNMILKLLESEEEIDLETNRSRLLKKAMYVTYEIKETHLFKFLVGISVGKNWREVTKENKEAFIEKYGENLAIVEGLELTELLDHVWLFHPNVFVVDYDQLIPTKGRFDNEERRVAHITRSLKDVAVQTGSVCVLLSQVNEEGQARYSREKEHASSVHVHLTRDENNEDIIHYEVRLNRWGRSGDKGNLSVNWETRQISIVDSSNNPWSGAIA